MNVQLNPNLRVTTAHPLSHDGKAVLVVGNGLRPDDGGPVAFGPADLIEIFGRTAPAAYWACFYGQTLTGAEREAIADYLRQWQKGPQLDEEQRGASAPDAPPP